MDSQKKAFVKETSAQIFAAFLIEDRIAWHKIELRGIKTKVVETLATS